MNIHIYIYIKIRENKTAKEHKKIVLWKGYEAKRISRKKAMHITVIPRNAHNKVVMELIIKKTLSFQNLYISTNIFKLCKQITKK